jgi:transposase-like protein/IS1 family transposase
MTCAKCQHSTVKKFGRYGRHRIQRYRCTSCSTTFSDPKPATTFAVRVDEAAALQAVQCLIEGCSLRSTERLTGLHRDTIMRLLILAGERCARLLDARMRNLKCNYIQCDEIWTFCFKKQRQVRKDDPAECGDQWVFVAIDAETKLIPSFAVGKRSRDTTNKFMADLEQRITDRCQLTTDGFHFYERAVENTFAGRADYAQLIKLYGDYGQFGNERYSPGRITEVISKVRDGRPDPEHISTSHVERQNLTMRMQMRRFTRLTNAFSKKLDNLKAAIALHFGFYNYCRVHKTLRVTPAMQAGIADHIWTLKELLASAIS